MPPARSRPQPRQQGRLALCLQIKAAGAHPEPLPHARIEAAVALGASLLDPEGNRLLLLVSP